MKKKEKPLGQQLDEGFAILSGVLLRRISDAEYRMSAKIDALAEAKKQQDTPKPFPFRIGKCTVLRSIGNKHTVIDARIVDVDMYVNGEKHCVVIADKVVPSDSDIRIFDKNGNCPYISHLKLSQP